MHASSLLEVPSSLPVATCKIFLSSHFLPFALHVLHPGHTLGKLAHVA